MKIFIRNDVILNDVYFRSPQIGYVAGERGNIFYTDNGGKSFMRINLLTLPGDENEWMDESELPSLFFIVASGNIAFTGGGNGYLFRLKLNKSGRPLSWQRVKFPWVMEETLFSADMKGDTVCIAGAYGTMLYSFDTGVTFHRVESEEFAVRWFRRAAALREGICLFAGEKGAGVIVSE